MLVVETVARIGRAHFVQGRTIKAIARELGIARNTIRRVLRSGETSFSYEREVQPRGALYRAVQRKTLAQPAPQPEPGPAGKARVQRGEGNAREPPGDAPLHAAEGQHPNQPEHAPP